MLTRILGVHVVDRLAQKVDRLERIDPLPEQVRWIQLHR